MPCQNTDVFAKEDLREYIDVLIRWWKEILLLSILSVTVAALAIIGLRYSQAPIYKASATVVIAGLVSDVTLDERFRTLSDDTTDGESLTTSAAVVVRRAHHVTR